MAPASDAEAMERSPRVGPPLFVTADAALAEHLLRLSAAAAVTPEVVSSAGEIRPHWRSAACVFIGADLADSVAALQLPPRDGVVLVASGLETTDLWQQGVTLRVEQVAVLPSGSADLVERLADCIDGAATTCLTLGVVGARGGVGASTLAVALAVCAARRSLSTLLVDADPLAGGLDLVGGWEDLDGLRWPEVAATSGRISAGALRAALPSQASLAVLSWDRNGSARVDAASMRSILSAGQRGSQLVVVDLPRRLDDGAAEAAGTCDVLLLLATPDVRAVAGGERLLKQLGDLANDVRLVVRQGPGAVVTAEAVSAALGIPLLTTIPTQRRLARCIDEGLGVPARGRLAGRCAELLDQFGVEDKAR